MHASSLYRIILLAVLISVTGFPAVLTAQIYFDTAADSKLWLEGSSTVHRFDCVARSIQGTAFFDETGGTTTATRSTGSESSGSERPLASEKPESSQYGNTTHSSSGHQVVPVTDHSGLHVLLKIPIRSFDCGRTRMNRDMYDALKSDTFEFITFEFHHAQPYSKESPDTDSLFTDGYEPYLIEGVLNVAGVDRLVTLTVRGRPEERGRYRIKGHKEISMKDFEIEPPTALRGLIRAHDDLIVFFDLIVVEDTN